MRKLGDSIRSFPEMRPRCPQVTFGVLTRIPTDLRLAQGYRSQPLQNGTVPLRGNMHLSFARLSFWKRSHLLFAPRDFQASLQGRLLDGLFLGRSGHGTQVKQVPGSPHQGPQNSTSNSQGGGGSGNGITASAWRSTSAFSGPSTHHSSIYPPSFLLVLPGSQCSWCTTIS